MKRLYCFVIFTVVFSLKIVSAKGIYTTEKGELSTLALAENKSSSALSHAQSKDTLSLLLKYLSKADLNKNKGLYAVAFEDLWKALLLADATKNMNELAIIHDELGGLYGIYGKEEKAIEHKQLALQYVKKNAQENKGPLNNLGKAYYSLAVQYRKVKKYDESLIYLDSCLNSSKQQFKENNPYVLAEKGNVFLIKNQLKEAEVFLLKAKEYLEKGDKHYLVIVYSFLGDLYVKTNNTEKAIYFYELSLRKMADFNSHTDLKSDILKKIAVLYKQKNKLQKAFFYLEESTKIADSLFSMRGKNNSQLFEIKNKHQETLLIKEAKINKQERIIEKKKRIQSQLLFVIVFILFSLIIVIFLFYYKTKIRKLKTEQENAAIKIMHEKEKLNVVLETKSKELTVSTLQLIEKDKNVDRLLEALKIDAPTTYKQIQKDIVRGNKDLWKSFNLRFTEVNVDFYKRLSEKHTTLTPTEQKHCALIKLKFDSKEMASLLNISINSVHISRHRIRKKIGLQRVEDLSNYIASI